MIIKRRSLFLLGFFLTGTLVFFLRPLDDCDILTQIRLGYLGLDSFIKTENLIYWREGQTIANPGWLAQLVFALLDKVGGLLLVRYGYAVLLALSFVLVLHVTFRSIYKQYSVFSYAVGGIIGILIMLSNSSVRPQGFSLLGCSLLICLHYSKISSFRKLSFLALIGLFWQNLHPSLLVGILVYGLLTLQNFDKQRLLSWFGEICTGVAVLAVCCVLTPDGFDLIRISQENQRISMALGITEWLSAWSPGVIAAMIPFHVFIIIGVIVLIVKRNAYKITDVSLFLVFLPITLHVARFGFYMGLLAVPFFVKTVEQIRPKNFFRWNPDAPVRKVSFIILGLVYITLITGINLYLPRVSSFFPSEAIAALKNHPEVRRVFNYREYAGAMNYWGDKNWKLFIDGRLYLYPEKTWQFYNGVASGDKNSMNILCKEHHPDALLLRKGYFAEFLRQLDASKHVLCGEKWRKIYENDETVVLIPAGVL